MTLRTFIKAIVATIIMSVASNGALADATPQPAPGGIKIEQPWSRATPAGATVAAGYVTLTNEGTEPDRLTGVTFARAKNVEVHQMTNDEGVMKMRQLPEGVVLPPGMTVALKPGGVHLMMLNLSEPLKAGDTVAGTLQFEKAGSVDVTFTVAPLGAEKPDEPAPAAGASGHEHHNH